MFLLVCIEFRLAHCQLTFLTINSPKLLFSLTVTIRQYLHIISSFLSTDIRSSSSPDQFTLAVQKWNPDFSCENFSAWDKQSDETRLPARASDNLTIFTCISHTSNPISTSAKRKKTPSIWLSDFAEFTIFHKIQFFRDIIEKHSERVMKKRRKKWTHHRADQNNTRHVIKCSKISNLWRSSLRRAILMALLLRSM